MVDLSRGVSRAGTADYHAERKPDVIMGRQLAGNRAAAASAMAASAATSLISPRYWAWRSWSPIPLRASATPASSMCRSTICLAVPTLSFVCVANEQTENLIGQAALERMRADRFHQPVARQSRRRAALAAALRENRIAGAAMDVGSALDQMPTLGLAKLPNVIATPHIGGLTPPAIESQSLETVRQVEKIVAGEVPVGAVNASTWTRRP